MMTDFAATRALFHIPDGVVYMDGNSLGPAADRGARGASPTMLREEWGEAADPRLEQRRLDACSRAASATASAG